MLGLGEGDLLHARALLDACGIAAFYPIRRQLWYLCSVSLGLAISTLCLTLKVIFTQLVIFNRSRKIIEIKEKFKKTCIYSVAKWAQKNRISFIPFLIISVTPWAIISALSLLITIFTIAPLFGLNTAEKHLKKWTIDADHCTPLRNRDARTNGASMQEIEVRPKKNGYSLFIYMEKWSYARRRKTYHFN